MLEVIGNNYGKKLGRFEFDYLGEHARLDAIIMNADEQALRIRQFISNSGANNEWELLEAWRQHLNDTLSLPFYAKIMEGSPYLREGDIVRVTGLNEVDDLYGILACLKKGRKKFWYPLCDLEAAHTNSNHFQHVNDYSVWFCNR